MIRGLSLALALAFPASAGTLEGRPVTFEAVTWEDPAQPLVHAPGRTVVVGDGVEFFFAPDGVYNGLTVVPINVEIGPQRIEITYPEEAGESFFYQAAFNGYVLSFDTDCALFSGWKLDEGITTLPLEEDDIFTKGGSIYINVSGLPFGPQHRIAVDLDVMDCPIS